MHRVLLSGLRVRFPVRAAGELPFRGEKEPGKHCFQNISNQEWGYADSNGVGLTDLTSLDCSSLPTA